MLSSELEVQALSKENQRLKNQIRGLKIVIYGLLTSLVAFVILLALLAAMLGGK